MTEKKSVAVEKLVLLLLFSSPLFVLVHQDWSNFVLMIGSLLSLIILIRTSSSDYSDAMPASNLQSVLLIVSFSSIFVATFSAGIFRGKIDWQLLDSPSRFLLAIPVFLFVRNTVFLNGHSVRRFAVASIGITFLYQVFTQSQQHWSADRMSTHFADPLTFGYICLGLAFISFSTAIPYFSSNKWESFFTCIISSIGIWMSIKTASRTGWLAVPFVILAFAYSYYREINLKTIFLVFTASIFLLSAGYWLSPTIQSRSTSTIEEIKSYSFDGIAQDTSIGMRITFIRMAIDLIAKEPLIGLGDSQNNKIISPESVTKYASQHAQEFAYSSGFHNETLTNGVQSGLFAAISTISLFLIPGLIYTTALQSSNVRTRQSGLMGIVFVLVFFISSMSTEVFGLKYTTSFYATISAILCGLSMRTEHINPPKH